MMYKKYTSNILFFLLMLFGGNYYSQENKELEFNVVKPKVEISLEPAYNYLFQHISHPIKVVIKDSLNKYELKLAGGVVNVTDSGTFITPEASGEAILSIYQIKNGHPILVGSKKYVVLSEPKAYLRNKPTDNTLLDMLLVSGKLKAISFINNKKLELPVKSYTISYMIGNEFKSIDIEGDKIPTNEAKEIVKLPDGSMIYFENIAIELLPGITAIIQPYRITIQVVNSKDVINFGVENE